MTKSKKPLLSIIVAMDEKRGIGKNGKLLWHISEDLKRFRKITLSHPVIMGRNTFESIGKALPERTNIIVTRNKDFKIDGCKVCHSLNEAIEYAKKKDNQEIFIIGGGEIYNQAIDIADKLYLTKVKGNFNADTFFPDYSKFTKVLKKEEKKTKKYYYTFFELSQTD